MTGCLYQRGNRCDLEDDRICNDVEECPGWDYFADRGLICDEPPAKVS